MKGIDEQAPVSDWKDVLLPCGCYHGPACEVPLERLSWKLSTWLCTDISSSATLSSSSSHWVTPYFSLNWTILPDRSTAENNAVGSSWALARADSVPSQVESFPAGEATLVRRCECRTLCGPVRRTAPGRFPRRYEEPLKRRRQLQLSVRTRGSQWQAPECEPRSSEVHQMGRDITTTITTTKVNAGCSNHRVASFTQQGRRNAWQPLGWPIIPLPRHMFQSVPECSDEGPLFVVCDGSIGNCPALACTIGNPCQMSSCLVCPRGGTSSTPRLQT